MKQVLSGNLIRLADLLGEATSSKMSRAAVGRAALNDNTFYRRLEAGENFTIETHDRLVQWFSDHWPADLVWPASVSRPATSAPAELDRAPEPAGEAA